MSNSALTSDSYVSFEEVTDTSPANPLLRRADNLYKIFKSRKAYDGDKSDFRQEALLAALTYAKTQADPNKMSLTALMQFVTRSLKSAVISSITARRSDDLDQTVFVSEGTVYADVSEMSENVRNAIKTLPTTQRRELFDALDKTITVTRADVLWRLYVSGEKRQDIANELALDPEQSPRTKLNVVNFAEARAYESIYQILQSKPTSNAEKTIQRLLSVKYPPPAEQSDD
jgi:DNA-directed RNA polymerase specialized sigma24 family protein